MEARHLMAAVAVALMAAVLAGCGAARSPHSSATSAATLTGRLAAGRSSVVYEWGQFGGGLRRRNSGRVGRAARFGIGPVHHSPVTVPGLPGTVVQVATSNSDDYALLRDGSVWAWGAGAQGELGNGSRVALSETPVRVHFPPGVRIVSLPNPMPYNGAMAISAQGRVWAWGYDLAHEFCLRRAEILPTPVRVPLPDVTLAVGALRHTLYDSAGHIVSCGAGPVGQLGTGSARAYSARPVAVSGLPGGRALALTSAWGNAGVLMADGRYYDWGYNRGGQVGDGSTSVAPAAVQVALPHPIRAIFAGGGLGNDGQTIALLDNGTLWEWGSGTFGQLGDGHAVDATLPIRLRSLPEGLRPVAVASGGSTNYVIGSLGRLWAWGNNSVGQLGAGSTALRQLTPTLDPVTVSEVSSTAHNVVALGAPAS